MNRESTVRIHGAIGRDTCPPRTNDLVADRLIYSVHLTEVVKMPVHYQPGRVKGLEICSRARTDNAVKHVGKCDMVVYKIAIDWLLSMDNSNRAVRKINRADYFCRAQMRHHDHTGLLRAMLRPVSPFPSCDVCGTG